QMNQPCLLSKQLLFMDVFMILMCSVYFSIILYHYNIIYLFFFLFDGTLADALYKSVRILCWVMTGPNNLEKKARHVKATWSRHCNIVVFISSVDDPDFPTVGLNTKEGRDQLYWKTIRAFHYVMEKHGDEADWFLKADDDTYVVVDNLRWILANHSPEDPLYFGRRFKPYVKQGYMSGGAGYVLSKEALRRFVEGFRTKVCTHTSSVEDLALGQCMEKIGVVAGDSRDTLERETFHPFVPESHLTGTFPKTFWYWNYCYYPIVQSPSLIFLFFCLVHHVLRIGYRFIVFFVCLFVLFCFFPSQIAMT
uniref:N-acetylgalactosaminide beta-1,3-galactosyltransferase n=1 Tax=Cyprinus carpio TaxID=7962 RepID=A0A8C2I8F2_CYPCA